MARVSPLHNNTILMFNDSSLIRSNITFVSNLSRSSRHNADDEWATFVTHFRLLFELHTRALSNPGDLLPLVLRNITNTKYVILLFLLNDTCSS